MARIRWGSKEYAATPVRQLEGGDWEVRMYEHGDRFVPGSVIRVTASQIVEMNEIGAPPNFATSQGFAISQAELMAAMAKERETIPTVESLLKPIHQAAAPLRAAEADAVGGERAPFFPQQAKR